MDFFVFFNDFHYSHIDVFNFHDAVDSLVDKLIQDFNNSQMYFYYFYDFRDCRLGFCDFQDFRDSHEDF